jgi:hypothetical protein
VRKQFEEATARKAQVEDVSRKGEGQKGKPRDRERRKDLVEQECT